ncbi:TPA: hypothetical protein N0F65_007143 [Lagenidium giganteum]|uniref:Uncharacterized protein n=1 Tax=Lagenidium giganteum TaxID=4803 RepID=A0AAV2YXK6_9STRA|nr:TPA: hypothetical protein N0F65_007143 [Lagenidium giganteum]
MASQPKTKRKQLLAQLEASFDELERLTAEFKEPIDVLSESLTDNLTVNNTARWFRLYLHAVDWGVLIRRGEVRHRLSATKRFPCRHTTGTKAAVHTGLSIDDANAIYQQLEQHQLLSERKLERYFMRMDTLDADNVGTLDIRLNQCLTRFLQLRSTHFNRLELSGSDPHQRLLVIANGVTVATVVRECFSPTSCKCPSEDFMAWKSFELEKPDAISPKASARPVDNEGENETDVGLLDLKRQFGFEPSVDNESDDEATKLALLHKRQRKSGQESRQLPQPADFGVPVAKTPREQYVAMCQNVGAVPNQRVCDALEVRSGVLQLDLARVQFHSSRVLDDVTEIVQAAGVPVQSISVANNFFVASSFQSLLRLLQRPIVRQNLVRLDVQCTALPHGRALLELLEVLSATTLRNDETGLESVTVRFPQLQTLLFSSNTVSVEGEALLRSLVESGLPKLRELSLDGCFPKPASQYSKLLFAACTSHLTRFSCSSNKLPISALRSILSGSRSLLEALSLRNIEVCQNWDVDEPVVEEEADESATTVKLALPETLQEVSMSFATPGCPEGEFEGAVRECVNAIVPIARSLRSIDLDLRDTTIQVDPEVWTALAHNPSVENVRLLSHIPDGSTRNNQYGESFRHFLGASLSNLTSLHATVPERLTMAELSTLMNTARLSSNVKRVHLCASLVSQPPHQCCPDPTAFKQAFAFCHHVVLELNAPSFQIEPRTIMEELEAAWKSLNVATDSLKSDSDEYLPPTQPATQTPKKKLRTAFMYQRKVSRDDHSQQSDDRSVFVYNFDCVDE